jgi:hypothetical protein
MDKWVPVISAVLGLFAGLSGTWLTQRSTRKLESDRWAREQLSSRRQAVRQLYIDVAEYIEDRISSLEKSDLGIGGHAVPDFVKHQSQLGGRIKLFGSSHLIVGWEEFQFALDAIDVNWEYGNFSQRDDLPDRSDLDDQTLVPKAVVTGEVVLRIIRSEIESAPLVPLLRDLDRLLPEDGRYRAAFYELTSAGVAGRSPRSLAAVIGRIQRHDESRILRLTRRDVRKETRNAEAQAKARKRIEGDLGA